MQLVRLGGGTPLLHLPASSAQRVASSVAFEAVIMMCFRNKCEDDARET